MVKRAPVSFPAFHLKCGEQAGWEVPDSHLEACDWLEQGRTGRVGVLKAFRGFSKSTIVGEYPPWRLRQDPAWRFQTLSATDQDGAKMSAHSRQVINHHPWCQGMRGRGKLWKTHRFEVEGSSDPRNPSMSAYGVMSNITGGRADEFLLDDVEVPKTIRTPALREALRGRLSETGHILVPGGKILYIGTDHCLESIYKEQIEDGADLLEIPLFIRGVTHVVKDFPTAEFLFDWRVCRPDEIYVAVGESRPKLLAAPDYTVEGLRDFRGGRVVLRSPVPAGTRVSIYAGCTWPQRFNRGEVAFKMGRCRSWGEWDSQYMLRPAQIARVRLDPERIQVYDDAPELRIVNGGALMFLRGVRLVGASSYWDCSLGKINSDASSFSLVFTDGNGNLYWQVCVALTGDIYEQCGGIVPIVKRYSLRGVTVETNGPGGFVPAILRKVLKEANLDCAVIERWRSGNKNVFIADALEPPLSGRFLYASRAVMQGPMPQQMREWDPTVKSQPDDHLDSGAGAIAETPVRIGLNVPPPAESRDDWRPGSGTHEVQTDY
ncbi:MAG TPA: phage terminase large subunit [Geobacteraceae bacterium]